MYASFCYLLVCFTIQTQVQGGSSSVSHFGTPPLITSMPHAGAQRSTSGDSLTVSRSVMSVRNINIEYLSLAVFLMPIFSHTWKLDGLDDHMFVVPADVFLSCVFHTCYIVSQTLSLQLSCRMVRLSARVAGRMKKGGDRGLQGMYTFSSHDMFIFSIISVSAMSKCTHL